MSFDIRKRMRWLTSVLVVTMLLLPATSGGRVLAQADGFVAEWEITFEVVDGAPVATWIGRVWEVEDEVETLREQRRVDITPSCVVFGAPIFGRSFVDFDGVDDYVTCQIPNIQQEFGKMVPELGKCRCRFDGPPYAAVDVSPVLTTEPQTVIYHRQLHLEVLQRNDVADLELSQGISHAAPEIGQEVAFSLTVTNHGPAPATGVTVADELPSGYSFVDESSGGDYDPTTGIWTVGTLAAEASATLHISATTEESGDFVNVAQIATSNETDPDSTPGNLPASEDDNAAAIMNPLLEKVRFPLVKTGLLEESTAASVQASEAVTDVYGQAQLTLHFISDTVPITPSVLITEQVKSWKSNIFPVPQDNGIQVWAGYNAARYVAINDENGFGQFLSVDGFWDAVDAGSFVEGFYMWESEAQQKYDPDPLPAHFNLGSGTLIYIGYNPDLDRYFEGTVRAASIDPGCRGH